jgi:hypothetical protein
MANGFACRRARHTGYGWVMCGCLSLAVLTSGGAARAQVADDAATDFSAEAAAASQAVSAAPEPPTRPQVPYASDLPEVTVYGPRLPFGLPDSVREDIWEGERRQIEAMLLERERMSNDLARDGFDALLGDRIALLPAYNPNQERQIDYGVDDSTPAGVITLFGGGFGGKKKKK